jgi:hypothetical protein
MHCPQVHCTIGGFATASTNPVWFLFEVVALHPTSPQVLSPEGAGTGFQRVHGDFAAPLALSSFDPDEKKPFTPSMTLAIFESGELDSDCVPL